MRRHAVRDRRSLPCCGEAATATEEFQATNRVFDEEVVGRGDFGALERVYTPDARILPPGSPVVTGIPAIAEFWRGTAASLGVEGIELRTVSLDVLGDRAQEVGRAELAVNGAAVGSGWTAAGVGTWTSGTPTADAAGAAGPGSLRGRNAAWRGPGAATRPFGQGTGHWPMTTTNSSGSGRGAPPGGSAPKPSSTRP